MHFKLCQYDDSGIMYSELASSRIHSILLNSRVYATHFVLFTRVGCVSCA